MANPRICSIDGCGKPVLNIRGWCNAHYIRWRRHGSPLGGGPSHEPLPYKCKVDGCDKRAKSKGWCPMHYARWIDHGDPLLGARQKTPTCKVVGCNKIADGRGYCAGHLARVNRHGDPLYGGDLVRRAKNGEALKWILDHLGYVGDDCLIWPFGRDTNGYGGLLYEGKDNRAHRVMCLKAHGEPPEHDCDAAHECGAGHLGCVHPQHLRWKTRTENMQDKLLHGTHNRGERAPGSKLTEADVRRIRDLKRINNRSEIAAMFGVSVTSVRLIHIGRNWSWLE